MDDNKFLQKLSQDLLEIFNDEEYYDITIEVGDDPYVKIFRAHMIILNYRSAYLRRILSTNKKKNDENLVHIKLKNILPEIFQIILRYIYGGRIPLEEYDTSDIIKILLAAKELSLQELIPHLQSFLIQNKSNWVEQNFNLVYQTSFKNDSFIELRKFCIKLMSKEPEKIFKSLDFTSISEKSLISLIQNDNLKKMKEVQVWEHIIKWGFAKNPELSLDNLENFSKDDFNTLKNTLQQCIPFVKFRNLTCREFSEKVVPYKKILPKELYKGLLKDFLDNDNKPIKESEAKETKIEDKVLPNNIDSKIITYQHAELISKWIDKLEITDEVKNLYEFKLILRGSRDGFTPENFHEICDNQSHTVSVIKVKNSNEILGGYNPIEWKFGDRYFVRYGTTKDSFIFSFENKENFKDYVLSRVVDEKYALCYSLFYGPSFGSGDFKLYEDDKINFGSLDYFKLYTRKDRKDEISFYNNSYCKSKSYEKPIRKTEKEFSVVEYEVFQIVKIGT